MEGSDDSSKTTTQVASAQTISLPQKNKSKLRLIIVIVIVIVALLLAFFWWEGYRKYITSDDANLDSYRVNVAPQVTGLISKLYVHEGDTVKKGDLLFEIENKAILSKYAASQAQYNRTVSDIEISKLALIEAQKQLELANVSAALVKKNFDRAKIQYKGDAITLEEFQTWEENWKSAGLKVDIAKKKIGRAHV